MSPLRLHCRAEEYLNIFFPTLDDKRKHKIRECILKYIPPEASAPRSQKINYNVFIIFNFFKSLIHQSKWQTTVKETKTFYSPNSKNLPVKAKKDIEKALIAVMQPHIHSAESSPAVTVKLNTLATVISTGKIEGDITLTEEDLGENSLKCPHGNHSYWN